MLEFADIIFFKIIDPFWFFFRNLFRRKLILKQLFLIDYRWLLAGIIVLNFYILLLRKQSQFTIVHSVRVLHALQHLWIPCLLKVYSTLSFRFWIQSDRSLLNRLLFVSLHVYFRIWRNWWASVLLPVYFHCHFEVSLVLLNYIVLVTKIYLVLILDWWVLYTLIIIYHAFLIFIFMVFIPIYFLYFIVL